MAPEEPFPPSWEEGARLWAGIAEAERFFMGESKVQRAVEKVVRIVHGDFRLDNTVVAHDRPDIIAVLDWELSTLGDPLADLLTRNAIAYAGDTNLRFKGGEYEWRFAGGGSYIVAHENLGNLPGVIAASALLSDYVLTVSVSIAAGTLAITSAAPALAEHKVILSMGFIALVALANLRGVKEAGTLFAVPTYGFFLMVVVTIVSGFFRCLGGCPTAVSANLVLEEHSALTLFLILRAFSSGATALTGVEAIADGVQAFRRPQSRNAATTLAAMGGMSI